MSRPSTTSAVKEIIERAQRSENEKVIPRCCVVAMQCEMDILKNSVEELRKERYPATNTEG